MLLLNHFFKEVILDIINSILINKYDLQNSASIFFTRQLYFNLSENLYNLFKKYKIISLKVQLLSNDEFCINNELIKSILKTNDPLNPKKRHYFKVH